MWGLSKLDCFENTEVVPVARAVQALDPGAVQAVQHVHAVQVGPLSQLAVQLLAKLCLYSGQGYAVALQVMFGSAMLPLFVFLC